MNGRPSRGQATIGFALIVGIALIGVVTVVALGATALTDIQTSSGTGAAEQAMTQFDSKTSQVALGDSNTQTVSVGQTAGSYQVDPDAGYVQVVHQNFDGVNNGPGDPNDHVIYETKLGTVSYERGDTAVAYQSGGVWKKTGDGQSRMVSPPEFHYRGSTLTFPIVRVNQDSNSVQSGGGAVDLRVSQSGEPVDIFPDRNSGYPDTDSDGDGFVDADNPGDDDDDGDGGAYVNPSEDGTVVVYIESEYYKAWAEYFEDRTDGAIQTSDTGGALINANPDPAGDGNDGQVVAVELVSTGQTGTFAMPGEGSSLGVSGVSDHSMTDFEITVAPDTNDQASFNNLQWSMYVDDGGKEFEMHLRSDGGGSCSNQEFTLVIFYSPAGTDDYHGWKQENMDSFKQCSDLDGDGDDEIRLNPHFVDDEDDDGKPREPGDASENDFNLTYTSLSSNDLIHFGVGGSSDRDLIASPTFDQHASGVGWESITYDADTSDDTNPSEETTDGLVNHYFSLLGPGFDLVVDDKSGSSVQESDSAGNIEYAGGDEFITFIHISKNDVEVTID
ncbi:DUF7289 family protein [Haloglomus halophilum]|uniref:DUF7289 family protein n=1 Tax=Haloglomus halophilum TaxID=2962672 RepID=UPI0020C9472E|nr:hypothetical protein [Haloglomus halophilum]